MVKIKYTGNYNCNVTVYNVTLNWNKGDIQELSEILANKIVENSNFIRVESEFKETNSNKKPEEKIEKISTKSEFSKKIIKNKMEDSVL